MASGSHSSWGSPQQQQKGSQVACASMRCVLCGGPFRQPTPHDKVSHCLTGPSRSFRWLHEWRSLPAAADKRRRGEAPALYTHKECHMLLQQKLDIRALHCHIWPIVKDCSTAADGIPDSLPASKYGGIAAVLDPAGSRSSNTTLSPHFKIEDSWMLHSPLVCTKQASRILSIWAPKLSAAGTHPRGLVQQLNSLLLNSLSKVSGPRTPTTSAGGAASATATAPAPCQPDLIDILLRSTCMHDPQVVAKLHMTSVAMRARLAAALAGRLHLCFTSCSTESVVSLSLWLQQHAALLATLEVGVRVCCCNEDEAAADTALAGALAATATLNPSLRMRAFSTSYSRSQLLSPKCMGLPCLQHLTHLSVPDLSTQAHISCLPPQLCSLDITKSTANATALHWISKQCPALQAVRLGYSLWPSNRNSGSLLLDQALNGWVLLPVVELRFIGCRLPRGYTAQSSSEPPFMSKAALNQLGNLGNLHHLTRLVFDGCCVDAPVSQFASVLSKLSSLKALDLAEPSGVLTTEYGGALPRCFVDSTSTLLQAANRKAAGC